MDQGRPINVSLTLVTGTGPVSEMCRGAVTVERGETSLVTRDSIERAVLDALAVLMDRSGL